MTKYLNYPKEDGIIRTVTVKAANSELKWNVKRLSVLPLFDNENIKEMWLIPVIVIAEVYTDRNLMVESTIFDSILEPLWISAS